MNKVHIVTLRRLERALNRVIPELERHGFWDDRMDDVDVCLVGVRSAYGYQDYGGSGEIWIPAVSLSKIADRFTGRYTALADVLRHEYGHAFADTHRGLMRRRSFRQAFWTTIGDDDPMRYDPDFHVTPYAATNAGEDFAETFMLYLKHGGRLPKKLDTG